MEMVIQHFCHEHPLVLTETPDDQETQLYCYGCRKSVTSEPAYVCSQQYCGGAIILHKRCAEMPRQILHPSHPEHPLHLFDYQRRRRYRCRLCSHYFRRVLRYRCSLCNFNIHISCPQLGFIDDLLEEKRLEHPSHHHPLTLMMKPSFLFHCDGCGTQDSDMAYACSTCGLLIHKTCALLPIILPTNHHHHHLSLAFCFPIEHRKFVYKCEICHEECPTTCWVYYCGDCKYFAHVKCATTQEIIPAESSNLSSTDGSDDVIELPVHDISKELITPFIVRAREKNGLDKIPDAKDMPPSIVMPETTERFSLLFNYHKHPLSLVWEGPIDELMICDVCVTPIYSPPYYNCPTCSKYFLHSTCYFLPKTLSPPDPQLYGDCPENENHTLTPYESSELDRRSLFCDFCEFPTNGMVYKCEDCELTIDVKCASLPITIKHASHPQHELIMRRMPETEDGTFCGCGFRISNDTFAAYFCTSSDDCDFVLSLKCALMPQSVKHKGDKHPLLLTFDASIDHPTDFYCDFCEEEMHPKRWMYHCRECDRSFHYQCLKTECSNYRNIKFGRQLEFDNRLHPHPLTYIQVTLKLRCHICFRNCYKYRGFECESCNSVVCLNCGIRELRKM